MQTSDQSPRSGLARPARVVGALALLAAAFALGACTTDQVLDTSRYWGDRVTGATLGADPSND